MLNRRRFLKHSCAAVAAACAPYSLYAAAANSQQGSSIQSFIQALPKAELHIHIEGTLEPEMNFKMAKRNNIELPYSTLDEMRKSYERIHDLQSFLAVYYEGANVLRTELDFYELGVAYLKKAASQNIRYVEMFFDPQQHINRGVPIADVFNGLTKAQAYAEREFGISSQLIMCFLRELSAQSAMETLEAALPYKQYLVGVGLDSDEKDNPPNKFDEVFKKARQEGLRVTVHCDLNQKNTHEHIRQAIEDLQVDRIDHGGNIIDSPELIALTKQHGLYLTLCPGASGTSYDNGKPVDVLRTMLDEGLKATINSDDPAYMGGKYLLQTFIDAQQRSNLTRQEMYQISKNAFEAAWLAPQKKQQYLTEMADFAKQWGLNA